MTEREMMEGLAEILVFRTRLDHNKKQYVSVCDPFPEIEISNHNAIEAFRILYAKIDSILVKMDNDKLAFFVAIHRKPTMKLLTQGPAE